MAVGYGVDLSEHAIDGNAVHRALRRLADGGLPTTGQAIWNGTDFRTDVARKDKAPLDALLTRLHGMELIDGGDGPEAVGVPFTHLVLLTADDPSNWAPLAATVLEQALVRSFRHTIDPRLKAQVRILEGRDHHESLSVYFGYGVFAPAPTERPIGRVEIVMADAADPAPLEPSLGGQIPAGLYAGQRGLTFADDETMAAATVPGLGTGHAFYLGRTPGDETGNVLPDLGFHCLKRQPDAPPVAARRLSAGDVGSGFDGAWRLSAGGRDWADVRYCLDDRPWRLRRSVPAGGGLAIVGVADPAAFVRERIDRWWIDLDDGGSLVASAMTRRALSLVSEGRRRRSFSWRRHAYDRRPRPEREPTTVDGRPLTLVEEGALGAIPVPPAPVTVGFNAEDGFDWTLDWLNHAVFVETMAGSSGGFPCHVQPRFGYRLAPVDGGLTVTALDGSGVAVASATAPQRFERRTDVRLKADDRVIVGPLVLAYRPSGASA